ncbi:MAG: hypothetical protein ACI81V_000608 [Lentimonas sp.]|jgi:hypothetical protein
MLLPPDLSDWIPEDHMVHFILDVVPDMDVSDLLTQIQLGFETRIVHLYCTTP